MVNSKLLLFLGISFLSLKGFSQTETMVVKGNLTENRNSLPEKLSNYMQTQADVKGNLSLYKLFKGNYQDIKILENNGKLYYNDFDIELLPESDNKFFRSDDDNKTVEFINDTDGKYSIIKLTRYQLPYFPL